MRATGRGDQAIRQNARRAQLIFWGPLCCALGVVLLIAGISATVHGVPSAFVALILATLFLVVGIVLLAALRRTPRIEVDWTTTTRTAAELSRQAISPVILGSLELAGSAVLTVVGMVAIARDQAAFLVALIIGCLLALVGVFSISYAVVLRRAVREHQEAITQKP